MTNVISETEYTQDIIQNKVNDIFGQNQYIKEKKDNGFFDIKTKLQSIIYSFSDNDISIEKELNDKFLDLDFGSEFEINADKIGVNDAIFFINVLNQENLINYSVNDNNITLTTYDNKKINASSSLLNMLQTSFDSKKPIRLDFDKDVTVILKLDKEGKIQAHFIPGSNEVETYIKNNISCLKQRFDEENINYSELSYQKNKDNQQSKKRNKR